jgi:hypothetical protein
MSPNQAEENDWINHKPVARILGHHSLAMKCFFPACVRLEYFRQ